MNRFMAKYHPMGELAPGDVVARAIVHEMEVSRAKDPFVYLDLTHLNATKVQKHFPRIYAACMQHNIDITEDMIPVRPGGTLLPWAGVRTDLDGKTNVPGSYAAGEAATTGVHGANRLPSNSLLEGLVYGARAREGDARGSEAGPADKHATRRPPTRTARSMRAWKNSSAQIQDLMWNDVGIVRTAHGHAEGDHDSGRDGSETGAP